MPKKLIDQMVDRFLCWDLPEDFAPDCHVSFDRDAARYNQHSWPSGTNLLTADQARQMFEHCMAEEAPANGLQPHQQRVVAEKEELSEKLARLLAFFQTPTFEGLPDAERSRLRNQARFMDGYAAVLEERIAAFAG